jgi:hypothetical protein
MSGGGSEETPAGESDHAPTRFGYGDGGVPLYVGIVWVVFIISYLAVMCVVALPDFIAWTSV